VRKILAYFSTGMWILLAVGLLLLTLMVWLLWPLRHPEVPAFQPENAVAAIVIDLDGDSELTSLALEVGRERLLGSDPGFLKRALFSVGVSLAMPRSVTVWIAPGESPTSPRYLAVASMDRGGRIVRLLGRGVIKSRLIDAPRDTVRVAGARITSSTQSDDGFSPGAFAFESDSLLIASDLGMIRDVLAPEVRGEAAEAFAEDIVSQSEGDTDASVVGTNRTAELTGIIQAVEDRFAFALMPSVDALSAFAIQTTLLAGDIVGTAEFNYTDPERVAEGYSDVRYLRGAVRRKLRGMGLELDAEVAEEESRVTMEFTVPGLAEYVRSTGESE
jgi:hypothetical protein